MDIAHNDPATDDYLRQFSTLEFELEWMGAEGPTEVELSRVHDRFYALLFGAQALHWSAVKALTGLSSAHDTLKSFTGATMMTGLTRAIWQTHRDQMGDWFVSVKADGERTIIYCNGGPIYALGGGTDALELAPGCMTTFVCDAECIGEQYYIFDVLFCDDTCLVELLYEQRRDHIARIVALQPALFAQKEFMRVRDCSVAEAGRLMREFPHMNDGLVFVPHNEPYVRTGGYKWKPVEQTTIDFYAHYVRSNDYIGYILFCTAGRDQRDNLGLQQYPDQYDLPAGSGPVAGARKVPCQFISTIWPHSYQWPNEDPKYDGCIVELGATWRADRLANPLEWHFVREREDRRGEPEYWGNNIKVADSTMAAYYDPLPLEALWPTAEVARSYFTSEQRSADTFAMRKIMRRIVHHMIRDSLDADRMHTLVDLASGVGADLKPYMDWAGHTLDERRLLCMDIDPTDISRLVLRRHEFYKSKLHTSAAVADLTRPWTQTVAQLSAYEFDVGDIDFINCSFAAHHLCANVAAVENFATLCSSLLSDAGGILTLAVPDGSLIYALGTSWSYEDKYQVQRAESSEFTGYDQPVRIKLPMDSELKEEPLLNIGALVAAMATKNLKLMQTIAFADRIDEFPSLAQQLDDGDRKWISLYKILIFERQ